MYSEKRNDLINDNKELNSHDDRKTINFLCTNCGNEITADNPFN